MTDGTNTEGRRKEDTRDSNKNNNNTNDNSNNLKQKPGARVNVAKGEACILCNETHNNANEEFIQCKKFLQMTRKQRCDFVFSKKKCMQCLSCTPRWNEKDHIKNCSTKWRC